MPKIKSPSKLSGGRIPRPPPLANVHLTMSFKYFHEREPFCVRNGPDRYVETLLGRLKNVCSMAMSALRTSDCKALRSHPIRWHETTEADGFDHLNSQLREQIGDGWQFSVSTSGHGRVHGFIIGEVFYVVWLDPEHKLYTRN